MVEAQIILLNFNNVKITNGNRGDTMNIELKHIVIKIDDAEFVFKNTGLNGFFEVEEKRSAKPVADIRGCIQLTLDNLIGVSGVICEGKEVSLEDFKIMNLPASLIMRLFREYADGLANDVIGDTKEVAKASEKNEELPTGSSGVSTSLN